MLQKKTKTIEDLEELDYLEAEAEGSEDSHSKRLYYKGFNTNSSSSNTQAVSSNSAISVSLSNILNRVNLSALFHLPFWDSFLANFFSSGVVDSLASDDLSSRGETP